MRCSLRIMVFIAASALVVFSAPVASESGKIIATTIPGFLSEYNKKSPPKAVTIADGGWLGGWTGFVSWGEVNVDVARAKALEGCKAQVKKLDVPANRKIHDFHLLARILP